MTEKTLSVGIKGSHEQYVTERMTAATVGSGLAQVFATPMMITLAEKTCHDTVHPLLQPEEATVGTRIDISHLSPTPIGMTVRCECELVKVENRHLTFSVSIYDEVELIGTGIHERHIVNASRFQTKADNKRKQQI
ncbi:MAG: thioesterase family protein [Bacteroidales bacterium]|nr:thioesterase family protein [Bacteroidales bacterium]